MVKMPGCVSESRFSPPLLLAVTITVVWGIIAGSLYPLLALLVALISLLASIFRAGDAPA